MTRLALRRWVALGSCILFVLTNRAQIAPAAPVHHWQYAPYRVAVLVAVDGTGQLQGTLEAELTRYIERRIDACIGAVWEYDLQLATGSLRYAMATAIEAIERGDLPERLQPFEKVILVSVTARDGEYRIASREFDSYVNRWSVAQARKTRQLSALREQTFQAIVDTFAPLAHFDLAPSDKDRIVLELKGAEIPTPDPTLNWLQTSDLVLPVLRRTTREGVLVDDGLQVVPWTYGVVAGGSDPVGDADQVLKAEILSGTRRPFGVRRRGRVEQVAIAIRGDPHTVTIRLISRADESKRLAGYQVYSKSPTDGDLTYVGFTNVAGELAIAPADGRLQMLYLKNGKQLLARVPVLPVAETVIEIALPDDDPRLQAEATLTALRENLIDLVARRNILVARIRQELQADNLDVARTLIAELDDLPGRAQFNRQLNEQEGRHRSGEAQIQRRIDKLFADTRIVLGHFLDSREVDQLRDELRAAQSGG